MQNAMRGVFPRMAFLFPKFFVTCMQTYNFWLIHTIYEGEVISCGARPPGRAISSRALNFGGTPVMPRPGGRGPHLSNLKNTV